MSESEPTYEGVAVTAANLAGIDALTDALGEQ